MYRPNIQSSEEDSRQETLKEEFRDFVFETAPNDELITALAEAYENRRARQVYEWEAIRQKSKQAAA